MRDQNKKQGEDVSNYRSQLSNFKTAAALGCSPDDLQNIVVECPSEKLAHVIGKKGATLKQIEEKHKVLVQRIEGNNINLVGPSDALAEAQSDIDRIVASKDEIVSVSEEAANYFNTKSIVALDGVKEQNPNVSIEPVRRSHTFRLRGPPDDISQAKQAMLAIKVSRKVISLPSKARSAIIGKDGVTVESIVSQHQATIEVRNKDKDDAATEIDVMVSGPSKNVEAAIVAIHAVLDENEQVSQTVTLSDGLKGTLKINKGEGIKELFKLVNEECRDGSKNSTVGVNFSDDGILLKSRAKLMSRAVSAAEAEIRRMEDMKKKFEVDSFVVPALFAKGSKGIKELTDGITGARIEIEKESGKDFLCVVGWRAEDIEKLAGALSKMLMVNKVQRVHLVGAQSLPQFMKLMRTKLSTTVTDGAAVLVDEDKAEVLIRGSDQELQNASKVVYEYLTENHIESRNLSMEDREFLLRGGKASKIAELSNQYGVTLGFEKNDVVLMARGSKENVEKALEAVDQFLHGNENGNAVRQISLVDETFGLALGKGGRTKNALESKYEGVTIVGRKGDTVLTVRGPQPDVDKCVKDILSNVATSKVTKRMNLSAEQEKTFKKKSAKLKEISLALSCGINLEERVAVLRGVYPTIDYAACLLQEILNGVFESGMRVCRSAFLKAQRSFSNNSQLDKIAEKHSIKTTFDESNLSIVVSGSKKAVQDAKKEIVHLLMFVLDGKLKDMEIDGTNARVLDNLSLLETAYATNTTVFYDRDIGRVLVSGEKAADAKEALSKLRQKLSESKDLMAVVQLESIQQASAIIGKGGTRIQELQSRTECTININKKDLTVIISAPNTEALGKAKAEVEAFLGKRERELKGDAFVELSKKDIPAFIGRKGAHLNEFSKKHGVELMIDDSKSQACINGEAEAVQSAVTALEEWKASRNNTSQTREKDPTEVYSSTIELDSTEEWLVSSILGKGGRRITGLRKTTACKIDVDTSALKITVSAEVEDRQRRGVEKLQEILDEERSKCAIVSMPADRLSAFIGFRGNHIREFEALHGVQVKANKQGDPGVKIFGQAEAVALAQTALEEWLSPGAENENDEAASNE